MDWRVKGVIQKVLGGVPYGERAHHALQRMVGGLRYFDADCDTKVDDWRFMAGHLRSVGTQIAGARFLEVGTGWHPTFPFCLYLGGAGEVLTLDLVPHLDRDRIVACAERLARHVSLIAERCARSEREVERAHGALVEALRRGASLEDATSGCVRDRAPADARHTGLDDGVMDVVFSNSVLEHVPPADIEALMREGHRVLRPGGVMFHSVNCGDHYAHVDGSISQLHYLRYSDRAWTRWNNRFLYQNRLRARDFVRMAETQGFRIEVNTARPTEQRRQQLARIPVHPSFTSRYTADELCITSVDFVARR